MRVAHIIKVTRISGAERHLLVLLTALRESAIDAHLIMLVEPDKPMDEMMSEAEQRGIPTRRLVIRRDYDLALLNALRRALREIKPDLVHTHLIHAISSVGLRRNWLASVRSSAAVITTISFVPTRHGAESAALCGA